MLRDPESGLEAPFALDLKSSGKGSVDIVWHTNSWALDPWLGAFCRRHNANARDSLTKNFPSSSFSRTNLYRQASSSAHLAPPRASSPRSSMSRLIRILIRLRPTTRSRCGTERCRRSTISSGRIRRTRPRLCRWSSSGQLLRLCRPCSLLCVLLSVLRSGCTNYSQWLSLGANISHFSKAMGTAPISHAVFFSSIIAMEGVFFMYYVSWNLFQALPVMGVVGTIIFLSGSKALGEIQSRRMAGER